METLGAMTPEQFESWTRTFPGTIELMGTVSIAAMEYYEYCAVPKDRNGWEMSGWSDGWDAAFKFLGLMGVLTYNRKGAVEYKSIVK